MILGRIFIISCILCYIIYFIYVSHVALSYFAVFLSVLTLCMRDYTFLPISSTSFCGCRHIHRFFAYDRVRFHFRWELPRSSLDSLPVSVDFCSLFASATETRRNFLHASGLVWLLSSVANQLFSSPMSGWLRARSCRVFPRVLASIPHGTKRWI